MGAIASGVEDVVRVANTDTSQGNQTPERKISGLRRAAFGVAREHVPVTLRTRARYQDLAGGRLRS